MYRNSGKVMEDALGRLLTLSSGLLGGSVVFLSDQMMSHFWRGGVFAFLLFSVAVCLFGILPRDLWFCAWVIEDVQRARNVTLDRRSKCLKFASLFLFIAMICAVVGVLSR